jgi:hypothetical protein
MSYPHPVNLLLQIFITGLLLFWPMVLFISVMMFDAPGSTEEIGNIVFALAVVFYPVLIGLGVFLFNFPLWKIPPKYVLAATLVVPALGAFLFGYPHMLKTRLAGLPTRGYFVKEAKVYHAGRRVEADAATFKPFSEEEGLGRSDYARDNQKVFVRGKPIPGADPATFHFLGESHRYQADKDRVYHEGKVLDGADVATFAMMRTPDNKPTEFYRDRRNVYFIGRALPLVKGAEARLVGLNHVADGQNAVYYNQPLAGADVNTLRVHPEDESIAMDRATVYYEGVPVPRADPATFQPLERSYAKDARRVYFLRRPAPWVIDGADAASFAVTMYDPATKSEAKDKMGYYLTGKRVRTK